MASVGLDVGVMWRLSEDLNVARRFAARVHQQQHHHQIHSHHRQTAAAASMIYNGRRIKTCSAREYQEFVSVI